MTVPHFFQSHAQTCGPACLRMLLAVFGLSVDESSIAQVCRLTPIGCGLQGLLAGAKALGVNADELRLTTETAALAALSNEVPFVAMIDLSTLENVLPLFQWHFVVPLGVVQDTVTFHDPADGPDRRAKLDDFLAAWATAGYGGIKIWMP